MQRLAGIRLSNGLLLEFVVSCAYGFDGRGWYFERSGLWKWYFKIQESEFSAIKTSTITFRPRKGNGPHYRTIRPHFSGDWVENAVGWRNPGMDWWYENIGMQANLEKLPLIVSIGSVDEENPQTEIYTMASQLNQISNKIAAIEVCCACPNLGHHFTSEYIQKSCKAAKRAAPNVPLLVSLGVTHSAELEKILLCLEEYGVEGIFLNSVPYGKVFFSRKSRYERFGGGGISGSIVQRRHWAFAEQIQRATSIPVIWPGVRNYDDISTVEILGAKAISFSSLCLTRPGRPNKIVRRYKREISDSND